VTSSLPSIGYRSGNGYEPRTNGNGSARPRVLFVCHENSIRSQMAEGFARMHGAGLLVAESAGPRPATRVNPRAVAAMSERGYDMTAHHARSLIVAGAGPWDYIVTMGVGDACQWVPVIEQIEWEIPDPAKLSDDAFRAVRDQIENAVLELLAKISVGRKL
jgi:protein-tyrosine-phosphatase